MVIAYTDTLYKGINHHGMQEGFVYDNIGMINVKTIDESGIDIRVLPKQEQDYFYDLLRGDSLGSGTAFPSTKKYGDRFYRTDLSKYYWWDGYDWVIYGEAYYLMLDYFPTKTGYLKTGARVFRTDLDKEYRYDGSSWVEITDTTGDTRKLVQSKNDMSVITSTDETGSYYYRINETDTLLTEFWAVVPLHKFVGSGDSSVGLQVFYTKGMYPQEFRCYVDGYDASYTIDSVDFTLQSLESTPPIPDIINASMEEDTSGDYWKYTVTEFTGGLYRRKFVVNYHYSDGLGGNIYDSDTLELTAVIGRLTCDEYDKYEHTEAYTVKRYVSKTGDNSNGGTSWDDAWLTIEYAASNISEGTLVLVNEGSYSPTTDITPPAGTSVKPIHFKAVGKVSVNTRTFDLDNVDYIIVDGFELNGVVSGGTDTNMRIRDSDNILVTNCIFNSNKTDYAVGLGVYRANNIFTIGNIYNGYNGVLSNTIVLNTGSLIAIFNTFNSTKGWWRDSTEAFYTYDSINEVGNYHITSIGANEDCIGTSSYVNEGITDPYPIVMLGATFDKAIAVNWLDTQMKYGVSDLISYVFSPFLRHIKPVNVPSSGNTRPHSFVKVIDGNDNERLVAYSTSAYGIDYGGCEIGACGEITDGMEHTMIENISGTNYSISPISRILDRNNNDDIIIEGRSIISETS